MDGGMVPLVRERPPGRGGVLLDPDGWVARWGATGVASRTTVVASDFDVLHRLLTTATMNGGHRPVRVLRADHPATVRAMRVRASHAESSRIRQGQRHVLHSLDRIQQVPLPERSPRVSEPPFQEEVMVFAHRVDDFAERRYEVSITVTVPAESVSEAITSVLSALAEIGVP
jgi:hypothetical protein